MKYKLLLIEKFNHNKRTKIFIGFLLVVIVLLVVLLTLNNQTETEIMEPINNVTQEEYDVIFEGNVTHSEALCQEITYASVVEVIKVYHSNRKGNSSYIEVGDTIAIPYNESLGLSSGDSVFVKCKGMWACVDFPNPDDPVPCQALSGGCGFHCMFTVVGKLR